MLTEKQVEAYKQDGYLKVEGLFRPEEVEALESHLNSIIEDWWGEESIGWRGPWRDHYLPEAERKKTKAVIIANPHFYSAAWSKVILHEGLVGCIQALIGPRAQWHHTVLHGKPPELGTPFPMHQDYPFYPHDGPGFVNCLVHLDDAPLESSCLCVVPGSHANGPLEHVTGEHTRPYLPPEKYHPDKIETVPIPAKAGDVIFFSYCTMVQCQPDKPILYNGPMSARQTNGENQCELATTHQRCVPSGWRPRNLTIKSLSAA